MHTSEIVIYRICLQIDHLVPRLQLWGACAGSVHCTDPTQETCAIDHADYVIPPGNVIWFIQGREYICLDRSRWSVNIWCVQGLERRTCWYYTWWLRETLWKTFSSLWHWLYSGVSLTNKPAHRRIKSGYIPSTDEKRDGETSARYRIERVLALHPPGISRVLMLPKLRYINYRNRNDKFSFSSASYPTRFRYRYPISNTITGDHS